ncbi:hypothetical protein [Nitrincola sp.]|uniref:hypothetical protein n=1 Tax=Nitrincola sp. TaxID=1926584 RepID=UPI003A9194F6
MTWDRFAYICRKAKGSLKAEESVVECISRIENESSCRLYGEDISRKSLSRNLLNKIGAIQDQGEAIKAFAIYSKIDILQHLSEPLQFKRVTIYLAYVTFIFFIISLIYQFKVTPTFLGLFQSLELPTPTHLIFYRDYWQYFILFIFMVLALSLIIGFTLKGLFKFQQGRENGLILRFFVFSGIRESYLRIIEVLSYPVSSIQNDHTANRSEITDHLSEIAASGMDLAVEMQALIKIEAMSLPEFR